MTKTYVYIKHLFNQLTSTHLLGSILSAHCFNFISTAVLKKLQLINKNKTVHIHLATLNI